MFVEKAEMLGNVDRWIDRWILNETEELKWVIFHRVDLAEVLDLHSFDSKDGAKWVGFVPVKFCEHKMHLKSRNIYILKNSDPHFY